MNVARDERIDKRLDGLSLPYPSANLRRADGDRLVARVDDGAGGGRRASTWLLGPRTDRRRFLLPAFDVPPRQHDKVRKLVDPLDVAPLRQTSNAVLADDPFERINRVGDFAAIELQRRDEEIIVALGRQHRHREAVESGRCLAIELERLA